MRRGPLDCRFKNKWESNLKNSKQPRYIEYIFEGLVEVRLYEKTRDDYRNDVQDLS